MPFDLQKNIKITTLFWIAISGLILTTIYTSVLVNQGMKTMRKLEFIYYRHKREAEKEMD